jgi:bifunctional non-homologous end joining protein LigD
MAKRDEAEVEIEGVRITHPNKILDEETQLTKAQLARYYSAVAEVMLPYIVGRPVSLVRCPNGVEQPCFFQRHAGAGLPEGVGSVRVKSLGSGKTEQYLTIDDAKGLVGLAQIGVLEIHPWGARSDALETPDRLIFDLDPGDGVEWKQLVSSAIEIRDRLKKMGLESFVKWTGGKGLHVVAPIKADRGWDEVKAFTQRFARRMEGENPKLYLTKAAKTARKERIFLDYLRNERGATAVAPYSPRARRGTHVAMPLTWDALKKMERPEFAVENFERWKARLKRDPWMKMVTLKQSLTARAMRAVNESVG